MDIRDRRVDGSYSHGGGIAGVRGEGASAKRRNGGDVLVFPDANRKLTAEQALRAAIDSQVFASLRDLESLDGGRAVQAVYVALLRRIPNVTPDRKRIAIDSGFSESSVKRAIGLLERCGLMRVERKKGSSSLYVMADLRDSEAASAALSEIRKRARESSTATNTLGRATTEPTLNGSRVTSEPTPRVTSERRPGPLLTHKETKKDQTKQQSAACRKGDSRLEVQEALKRWGLSSASFVAKPGHPKSVPLLASNVQSAAWLIDRTMSRTSWSESAGVGARVSYLREHVAEAVAELRAQSERLRERELRLEKRATEIVSGLPACGEATVAELDERERNILLERAFKRLCEPKEVVGKLLDNSSFRRRLIACEVVREDLEQRLHTMPSAEFFDLCERLFRARPALRRFYEGKDQQSTGLRLHLISFMQEDLPSVESESNPTCLHPRAADERGAVAPTR